VSSALAIAGVTQVLRDLLNDGLVNHNISGMVGSSVIVSTMPPDKVVQENGVEATQLNLFLRQVTPNVAWRNEGLPSRDASGRNRVSNAPLALDLHYVISAYGAADLHAEILLGYAMQLMHENPAISRDAIRTALQPSADVGTTLPPALSALADSGLQDQFEQLRIVPEYLSTEDMSKFWTSTLAHYRPSAAYQVSVVLIQREDPARQPLPVLMRSIKAIPALSPLVPTLTAVTPGEKQPVAQLDVTVTLDGFHLDGTARKVQLTNERLNIEVPIDLPDGGPAGKIEFQIPSARADEFPAGVYKVRVQAQPASELHPRITNELPLMLAPSFDVPPAAVTRDASGTASFALHFLPTLRAGQNPRLVLGATEYAPDAPATPAQTLHFSIPKAVPGEYLARLRIDGVDSPIIDLSAAHPAYLDKRIKIE
jgi:hypothetical protein